LLKLNKQEIVYYTCKAYDYMTITTLVA
jgi:hypothetical protein